MKQGMNLRYVRDVALEDLTFDKVLGEGIDVDQVMIGASITRIFMEGLSVSGAQEAPQVLDLAGVQNVDIEHVVALNCGTAVQVYDKASAWPAFSQFYENYYQADPHHDIVWNIDGTAFTEPANAACPLFVPRDSTDEEDAYRVLSADVSIKNVFHTGAGTFGANDNCFQLGRIGPTSVGDGCLDVISQRPPRDVRLDSFTSVGGATFLVGGMMDCTLSNITLRSMRARNSDEGSMLLRATLIDSGNACENPANTLSGTVTGVRIYGIGGYSTPGTRITSLSIEKPAQSDSADTLAVSGVSIADAKPGIRLDGGMGLTLSVDALRGNAIDMVSNSAAGVSLPPLALTLSSTTDLLPGQLGRPLLVTPSVALTLKLPPSGIVDRIFGPICHVGPANNIIVRKPPYGGAGIIKTLSPGMLASFRDTGTDWVAV
jgi:hypothetical protein